MEEESSVLDFVCLTTQESYPCLCRADTYFTSPENPTLKYKLFFEPRPVSPPRKAHPNPSVPHFLRHVIRCTLFQQNKVEGKPELSKQLHDEGERGLRTFGYEPERSLRESSGFQCAAERDPTCPKPTFPPPSSRSSRPKNLRAQAQVGFLRCIQ